MDDDNSVTVYRRDDYSKTFDPLAYLNDFYSRKDLEPAMHVMLRFLPNVASRVPKGGRLLDVGSGPTVHVAMCFRNSVDEIYLSDYVDANRQTIEAWLMSNGRSKPFDWSNISKYISLNESGEDSNWQQVETETKPKVKGVLSCDVFQPEVVQAPKDFWRTFDVVTTIFCLEYASNDADEYRTAVKNTVDLVTPGGYLVMGGVLEEHWYQFGGRRFACHYLTDDQVFDTLRLNNIDVDDEKTFRYFNHEGIFLIIARKRY